LTNRQNLLGRKKLRYNEAKNAWNLYPVPLLHNQASGLG
jgi:hypothetical protein